MFSKMSRFGKFPKNLRLFRNLWLKDSQNSSLFPPESRNLPTRIWGKPVNLGKVTRISQLWACSCLVLQLYIALYRADTSISLYMHTWGFIIQSKPLQLAMIDIFIEHALGEVSVVCVCVCALQKLTINKPRQHLSHIILLLQSLAPVCKTPISHTLTHLHILACSQTCTNTHTSNTHLPHFITQLLCVKPFSSALQGPHGWLWPPVHF